MPSGWSGSTKDAVSHRGAHGRVIPYGAKVFLHPTVVQSDVLRVLHPPELQLRRTYIMKYAAAFVVSNVPRVGQRASWCVALDGGVVADPSYLLSKHTRGIAIKLNKALASRREVCIADAFVAAHPTLGVIVVAKAGQPGSKWKLISRDALLARAARPNLNNVLLPW